MKPHIYRTKKINQIPNMRVPYIKRILKGPRYL